MNIKTIFEAQADVPDSVPSHEVARELEDGFKITVATRAPKLSEEFADQLGALFMHAGTNALIHVVERQIERASAAQQPFKCSVTHALAA